MSDRARIYHPHWAWEDNDAGLYNGPWDLPGEIVAARELLTDPGRLENAMRAVVDAWPRSAEHQLTNMERNRRAWLGWAACRHAAGAVALSTRAAWPQLTDSERDAANACAARVIADWEEDNGPAIDQDDAGQMAMFAPDDGGWDA